MFCSFLTLIESFKIFYLTSIRPTPERNLGLVEEGVSLEELPGDVELILNLRSTQIVMDFVQKVISSEPGASAVDDRVDNVLSGGQVGAPIKFEHVADLQIMLKNNVKKDFTILKEVSNMKINSNKSSLLNHRYLLRVRTGVHVDEQGVLVPLVEVVRKVKPDFGIVLSSVDLDVQVGDLRKILLGLLGEIHQRKLQLCFK